MDASFAADLVQNALTTTLVLALPAVAVVFLVSLVTSFLQALMQMQDQTLSTVPRLLVGVVVLLLMLPWMMDRLTVYTVELYDGVATTLTTPP